MTAAHAHTDLAAAQAEPDTPAHGRPRLVLATTILASSLAFIDGSVVNVGLPAIGRSLAADAADLQWLITAYLLPLSALLLLGGAAGDRFGRRRLLVLGTAIFALSSAGCAAAPTIAFLILARVCQGVGAAMLMPNSLALLANAFSGEARGRAIGVWAAAGAAMGALGPVLGGYLIDQFGWRSIFLINLPIAATAIGLAMICAPPATRKGGPPLDAVGSVLATLGLGLVTFGLILAGGESGWSATAIMALGWGGVALTLFVCAEWLQHDRAMMPLAMFASREFVGLSGLTVLLYGALGAFLVMIPYVLIETAHYSAVAAGAALLPFPLLIAATARTMGGLAGRIGPKALLTGGPLAAAVGYLLLLRIDARGGYWTEVLPAIVVIGLGMAGAVAPLTTAVLGSVDADHVGAASGFNSAAARAGGLVGAALLGGLLSAQGPQLIAALHLAAWACAVAALLSGLFAAALVANPVRGPAPS